jgi:hypothetical protein
MINKTPRKCSPQALEKIKTLAAQLIADLDRTRLAAELRKSIPESIKTFRNPEWQTVLDPYFEKILQRNCTSADSPKTRVRAMLGYLKYVEKFTRQQATMMVPYMAYFLHQRLINEAMNKDVTQ